MLAIVAVMEMAMIWPTERVMPRTWEMKMAATASYSAVPSMLMVAPMGSTNLLCGKKIPTFRQLKRFLAV